MSLSHLTNDPSSSPSNPPPGSKLRIPSHREILEAHDRIADIIHQTPVIRSAWFDRQTGAELFFKCENDQKTGSFKFRGACNAVLSLSDKDAARGVATHSSGNHGQAVAAAAKIRGIKAVVVMPENAPAVKVQAVKEYGGDVIFCRPTLESREQELQKVILERNLNFIHPYTNSNVICGQATTAIELMQQVPGLDYLLVPVGGGGLISGCALAVHYAANVHSHGVENHNPDHRSDSNPARSKLVQGEPGPLIIGTEPENADDAARSFHSGVHQTHGNRETIADGLRAVIGPINFTIISRHVSDMITVSEQDMISGMRHFWERTKRIIEPSCAVPLAALPALQERIRGKRVGVIITGGNVDLNRLPWLNMLSGNINPKQTPKASVKAANT